MVFKEGANQYEAIAIASALDDEVTLALRMYFLDSHFVYGPQCSKSKKCRQYLDFSIDFEVSANDLKSDGSNELLVTLVGPNLFESSRCTSYILLKNQDTWTAIGTVSGMSDISFSPNNKMGFLF